MESLQNFMAHGSAAVASINGLVPVDPDPPKPPSRGALKNMTKDLLQQKQGSQVFFYFYRFVPQLPGEGF